jgi:hypothetical protein
MDNLREIVNHEKKSYKKVKNKKNKKITKYDDSNEHASLHEDKLKFAFIDN